MNQVRKAKMFQSILLVDDSEKELQLSASMIEQVGLSEQVVQRSSVLSAVNYLQECVAERQPFPEIIMLDVNMPMLSGEDFLDVFDLFEPVLKMNSHLVILSSFRDKERIEKFKLHPYVDFILVKPIGYEQLEMALEEIQKKRLKRIGQWLDGFNGN